MLDERVMEQEHELEEQEAIKEALDGTLRYLDDLEKGLTGSRQLIRKAMDKVDKKSGSKQSGSQGTVGSASRSHML